MVKSEERLLDRLTEHGITRDYVERTVTKRPLDTGLTSAERETLTQMIRDADDRKSGKTPRRLDGSPRQRAANIPYLPPATPSTRKMPPPPRTRYVGARARA